MASNGKKKTTMAKIMRENKLRERRLDKLARKDARKREAALGPAPEADTDADAAEDDTASEPGEAQLAQPLQ
ncbi:hypothetical protein [Conexibacter sp. CPCC 206217]|uniref:hypothetical protein n=1 Tax=Conexibacter sp. CPCC 206217 TaxID=3064574 RepID=UPI0027227B6B|nr:hypothetical protein [Conexibacter sp. CPCC 206217]MDO8211128.1 hypothetical protein [Conexibacter sp. CPCC 206217]